MHLIARAADGSVRDGLSLLDQAIAHGSGEVGEEQVRSMIGLVDRTRTFDLFEAVMRGQAGAALENLAEQYRAGADPAVVVEDMLELVHWLTRVKLVPETADDPGVPEAERVRGRSFAEGLSMAALTRAWQMLLKGLGEVRLAPSPLQAAEMVLVRLAYAADLPTPADALAALAGGGEGTPVRTGARQPAGGPAPSPPSSMGGTPRAEPSGPEAPRAAGVGGGPVAGANAAPEAIAHAADGRADPASFADVVALALAEKEMILHANLVSNLHLVRFEPGRIEFRPGDRAPGELAHDLSRFLNVRTARRWVVTVSGDAGQPTIRQQEEARDASRRSQAGQHPLVRAVMETFPGAEIDSVRGAAEAPGPAAASADAEDAEAGEPD